MAHEIMDFFKQKARSVSEVASLPGAVIAEKGEASARDARKLRLELTDAQENLFDKVMEFEYNEARDMDPGRRVRDFRDSLFSAAWRQAIAEDVVRSEDG